MREQEIETLRIQIEAMLRQYPDLAEDELLRADMLSGETTIDEALTALIRVAEDGKAMAAATAAQMENLKKRADRFKQHNEYARALIFALLQSAELKKKELPEGTLYLRNNPPSLVGDVDADKLPDDLVKIERKPDRAAIKEALKAGRVIEGVALSNSPPSVVLVVR